MNASMKTLCRVCLITFACNAAAAFADDRADYQKRVATRFVNLFQELDRDRDGRVTRAEAAGDLNFLPALGEMDIDGDGAATRAELHRFIELKLGVQVQTAAQ